MSDHSNKHSGSTLAATRAGETIAIRRILFGTLRTLCSELDMHEGDVVRCRAGAPSLLLLDTPHGRTVTLERDWARFIEVDPLPDPGGG